MGKRNISNLYDAPKSSSQFSEGSKSKGILDDHAVRGNVASKEGTIEHVPTNDNHIANKKYVDDSFPVTHASTTGQTANDHHNESHNIASHSDTSATGTELNTLTDNSMADTLHRHSELSASDGTPDQALIVDAAGIVGITGLGTALKFSSGLTAAPTNSISPYIYRTGTASGAYPFSQYGNLILQARSSQATKDIVFMTGTTSPSVRMVINSVGDVGIGTGSPATSAKVDITSTTGALLLSRMTTAQKNALTAVNGMILYDSTLNKIQVYEGGAWASVI